MVPPFRVYVSRGRSEGVRKCASASERDDMREREGSRIAAPV